MHTTPAFRGLTCMDCGGAFDAAETTHRCPDCGGVLDPDYDRDAVTASPDELVDQGVDGLARYADLLPFPREHLVTMDEGTTPLVDCPTLADELGVDRVRPKDEGANPTGSVTDREQALAVTAAVEHGASDVALHSTGNAAQAAAAYAARAGLDSHAFVPSRTNFDTKAMINVHGGDMSVVGGRLDDAVEAFEDAMADHDDWYSLAPFETPYRHEGAKTIAYELAEALVWLAPDHVVCPTGHGTTLVGVHQGATRLERLGVVDDTPALYAAQAEGCAPIVEAYDDGRDDHDVWDQPDTICGGVEIPDPAGGHLVLEAIRDSDGGAVATSDADILQSAVDVAQQEGLEVGATPGVAVSGARKLAENGAFDADDTVVLVNTVAGSREADVLRSHLLSQGI
jgi:threonine synthase